LFLLQSPQQLTLLPLPLLLLKQLVPPLLLAPPQPLLHQQPARQRSNHFVTPEKAASGRLFCVWRFDLFPKPHALSLPGPFPRPGKV
jgi:hypothetical protein